jgi:hypothetical protein
VEIVVLPADHLLVRRQNIAVDQAVKLPIGQVIGEVEHHVLFVQPADGLVEIIADLLIRQIIGMRQFELRLEPFANR